MTENKSKCQRCNQEATKSLGLTKEGKVVETLMLCDSCYQKEVSCQECGKEDEKDMPQEVEKNGQKIKVCQDCKEKLKKASLEEILRKAREFKEQMKDSYKQVNENSPAEKIQEVVAKIDQFLCVNFRINIDDFAENKEKNMDNKDISQGERNAIGEAFPYPEYPKVVLEWRKNQQNKQPRERERAKVRWFS